MTDEKPVQVAFAPNPIQYMRAIRFFIEGKSISEAIQQLREYGERYAAWALAEVERTRALPAAGWQPIESVSEIECLVRDMLRAGYGDARSFSMKARMKRILVGLERKGYVIAKLRRPHEN